MNKHAIIKTMEVIMDYTLLPETPQSAREFDPASLQPFIRSLPTEDEQNHSLIVLLNLINLGGYVDDYGAVVALHTNVLRFREGVHLKMTPGTAAFTNSLGTFQKWDEMCGREAAMTLFHVGKSLMQIKSNLRFTETIKADSNADSLRKASGELERAFPNYNVARHAVGHRAEAMASLEQVKEHSIEIEGWQEFRMGRVEGDDYVATFEKKLIKVPLTEEARQRLNGVVALIYSAFPKLQPMLPPLNFGVQAPDNGEAQSEKL